MRLRGAAALLLLTAVVFSTPDRAEAAERWYRPIPHEGKVFPVLRSMDGRWLNWRDTFGAPRMRLQADGVWRQVGVHQGIDVFTEKGAPIVSMSHGRIERVGWTFYSGYRVGVRGNDGRYYFYAHLSAFAPGLAEGQPVVPGQPIGRIGNSGYGPEGTADEFPPHLHFGLMAGSAWVNPGPLLNGLYEAYVSGTRQAEQRIRMLDRRMRVLRARASGPAAPPPDALAAATRLLAEERGRLAALL